MSDLDQLNEIIPYIEDNKCALFIGSGLSNIAGCDNWSDMTIAIIKSVIQRSNFGGSVLSDDEKNQLKWYYENSLNDKNVDYYQIIDYCQEVYKQHKFEGFWDTIEESLSKKGHKYTNYVSIIKKIFSIEPKLSIITTNIDNKLEGVTNGFNDKLYKNSLYIIKEFDFRKLIEEAPLICHIHGYIESGEGHSGLKKSVIGMGKYIKRYRNPIYIKFLKDVFRNTHILFLGYSFGDVKLREILKDTKQGEHYHYALMPSDFNEMDSYKKNYNIKIIKYGEIKKFQGELERWIDENFVQGEFII